MRRSASILRPIALLALGFAPWVVASLRQEQSEIDAYMAANANDPVAKLINDIDAGKVKLAWSSKQGYLPSVLKALNLSTTTQMLVFSKTSLQSSYISPETPRAIYFNDQTYVGWIPEAHNIELASMDPELGPVFYTIDNHETSAAKPVRRRVECLQCHDAPTTRGVPGVMTRSVYTAADGQMRLDGGSFSTTADSPIKERWGGWYVTGLSGSQLHMGNEVAHGPDGSPELNIAAGTNVTDLSRYLSTDIYPTHQSDIIALMVAEQQMTIQDRIVKAGYLTRKTVKDAADLLKFGFTPAHVAEETQSRIKYACEPIVLALLCSGEPALTDPISGTSGFAAEYSKSAPADKSGRRLSELDLQTKLLKYPCSPMIYSALFAGLPAEAKAYVFGRLNEILSGKDASDRFSHLSAEDRKAVLTILTETLPEFKAAIQKQGS